MLAILLATAIANAACTAAAAIRRDGHALGGLIVTAAFAAAFIAAAAITAAAG